MCNFHVLFVILSIVVYTKCVGESEDGFEKKRYDSSLQMCIDNFDIHADKIIRTQDSRAMGAKYLNEAEVNGRDECLKLCCETTTCDVFVYEQKIPGSCYLFHCGTPEDFKCKFTQHKNYTSAVLTLNNHLSELENQIKLTKHEEELSRLRKPDTLLDTTIPPMLTTTTKVPAIPETKANHSLRSRCSRYQFECKSSGECIAIYNACDGIPQCSDGSDEAPELDCPGIAGTTRSKPLSEQLKMSTIQNPPLHAGNPDPVSPEPHQQLNSKTPPYRPPPAPVWQQQQSPSSMGYFPYGQPSMNEKIPEFPVHQKLDPQQQQQPPQQLANQAKIYGREGEGLAQQYPLGGVQWQGYQPQHSEGSHIFTHKGSGLVPDGSDSQMPGQYNNELSHSEYLKYAAAAAGNNGYYNGQNPMYYPGPNNWLPRQLHPQVMDDTQQRPNIGMYAAGNTGPGLSDYYYEDSQLRGRIPVQQDPRNFENGEASPYGQKLANEKEIPKPENQKPPPVKSEEEKPKKTESVKKTLGNQITAKPEKAEKNKVESTTASAKSEKPNHRVAEKLSMNEDDMVLKDIDGENERPSGAILSLTLGMCITAIMITLVGCRLRVVRRRMRRNGKSPYAHDPDFLVNGMYL